MDGFAGLSSAVRGKPCSGSVKLAYFLYLNQIKRTARRRSFIFSLKSYREYPDWLYCQKNPGCFAAYLSAFYGQKLLSFECRTLF